MDDKVTRLRKLLRDGWNIVHMDSEEGYLEATLQRGAQVLRMRFGAAEAARIIQAPLRLTSR